MTLSDLFIFLFVWGGKWGYFICAFYLPKEPLELANYPLPFPSAPNLGSSPHMTMGHP